MVLDLDDADPRGSGDMKIGTTPLPTSYQTIEQHVGPNWSPFHRNRRQVGICMSEMTFGFLIGVALLAGMGSIVFSSVACFIRYRRNKN